MFFVIERLEVLLTSSLSSFLCYFPMTMLNLILEVSSRVPCSWQRRRSDLMRFSTVDFPKESRDRYILNVSENMLSTSHLPSCSISSSVSFIDELSSDFPRR